MTIGLYIMSLPPPSERGINQKPDMSHRHSKGGVLLGATAGLAFFTQGVNNPAHADNPIPIPTSTPTPQGIVRELPSDFETSEKAFQRLSTPTRTPTPTPSSTATPTKDTVQRLEVSAEFQNLYGPEVTKAWLEENPQDISAKTDILDSNGEVIAQYVLLRSGNLYYTQKDNATNTFLDYKGIAHIPMENPRSIISSSDGQIVIVGGEDPIRTGKTKVVISYDKGKTWKEIPYPYQYAGVTTDLFSFTNNIYFSNNGNFERSSSQFIIAINPTNRTTNVRETNFEIVTAANFNVGDVGKAYDLQLMSVNGETNRVKMVSNGSSYLSEGILLFDLDYTTGNGTVEHINNIPIDGVETNLGYLDGGVTYTDPTNGHRYYKVSNVTRQILYTLDITDPKHVTGTKLNYWGLLNNRGIPNYGNDGLDLYTVDVSFDAQGNQHTWVGGEYFTTVEGLNYAIGRAVLLNLETGVFYTFASDKDPHVHTAATFIYSKGMQRKVINGQLGYELNIVNQGTTALSGKAFVPIDANGSPLPNARTYYTDKGLGSQVPIEPSPTPTPTPTPTSTPSSWRQYFPNISKSARNIIMGW